MVVGMGTTTQRPLHIVGENLASPKATTVSSEVLRRTVNQENSWGKLVRVLAGKVGGLASLESLHSEPMPGEPFADSDVAEGDRSFALAVNTLFDEQCDRWLDVEYRTIGRRLFARALLNNPTLIRKSSSPVRFATGLAHAVLAANDRIGRAEGQLRAKDIGAWFGSSSAGIRRAVWSRPLGSSRFTAMTMTTTGAIAPTIVYALRRPSFSTRRPGRAWWASANTWLPQSSGMRRHRKVGGPPSALMMDKQVGADRSPTSSP
jgi:hypothetical protein